MDPNRSRLPRATSNPVIRQPSNASVLSRLPAPTRLIRQNPISRKPSIPLRSNRKITPSETERTTSQQSKTIHCIAIASPAKRLLPSRSTLDLCDVANTGQPSIPLGPKRTVASKTSSRSTSITSDEANAPYKAGKDGQSSAKTTSPKQNNRTHYSENVFNTKQMGKSHVQSSSTIFGNSRHTSRREALALSVSSRFSKIPVTPPSRPLQQTNNQLPAGPSHPIDQTPVFPRLASSRWTASPDEQLKDLELSFSVEDDSNDTSLVEPLDFAFATSRFASHHPSGLARIAEPPRPEESLKLEVQQPDSAKLEHVESIAVMRQGMIHGVRDAWGNVVRAGEGDLAAVRTMMELIEALLADLNEFDNVA
ncbi:uncharacterized protein I206_106629 [Kwoniella pini CBS 10737]|uniref:Uncharacterized protein n=1 Tax=Kwoniella pini CBS 10737 TaxID=1296096 RepID=A0A1B9HTN0_9TREE|nr:uncharacterized protein I206_07480 [Kwoniella pini CBS 10737]OCF46627.1 hypothetical protein I206_07480 [Kwoniella pini CBS 10737]